MLVQCGAVCPLNLVHIWDMLDVYSGNNLIVAAKIHLCEIVTNFPLFAARRAVQSMLHGHVNTIQQILDARQLQVPGLEGTSTLQIGLACQQRTFPALALHLPSSNEIDETNEELFDTPAEVWWDLMEIYMVSEDDMLDLDNLNGLMATVGFTANAAVEYWDVLPEPDQDARIVIVQWYLPQARMWVYLHAQEIFVDPVDAAYQD